METFSSLRQIRIKLSGMYCALRLELARQMELLDKNEYKLYGSQNSLFWSGSDEQNRFTAMHHPFTMPMEEDLQYIDSDPGRVRAKAYDIVLNGNEIGGGSVRIHQPGDPE